MAVDGNTSTSFMQSANVFPSWWQVDLALPFRISQIEIEKRYDSDLDSYKNNFLILTSKIISRLITFKILILYIILTEIKISNILLLIRIILLKSIGKMSIAKKQ